MSNLDTWETLTAMSLKGTTFADLEAEAEAAGLRVINEPCEIVVKRNAMFGLLTHAGKDKYDFVVRVSEGQDLDAWVVFVYPSDLVSMRPKRRGRAMPKTCGEWAALFVIVAVMLGGAALCTFAAYGASVLFDLPWL